MKQKLLYTFLLGFLLFGVAEAQQQQQIRGKVTDAQDAKALSGVTIAVLGTSVATQSDAKGDYNLNATTGSTLVFSYIGYVSQHIILRSQAVVNVSLLRNEESLESVVVTALGISRAKSSLGYAAQEVKGDVLAAARGGNALQSLSGNVAGAVIGSPSSSLGGSTRIVLRGIGSLTGENRPLIVIDGIPLDNSNFNSVGGQRGVGGRDYGDASFDVNPDDIESINVLKGGPASALYGSRAANGVLLITTKGAKKGRDEIIINSGFSIDKLGVVPKLQKLYGGGFESKFAKENINGVEYSVVDYSADESWGPKFDGQQVLSWDAFDPDDAANYLKTQAWEYPKNDYKSFFNTGVGWTNSVSLAKSYENTSARLSASNLSQTGIVPNSNLKRSSLSLNIDNKFSDRLTVRGVLNYVNTRGFNRPEQGYGDNSIPQKMFQWSQRQLDFNRLKNYKTASGEQKSWNRSSWDDATPKYSDNFYWTIYENISRDVRNRTFGNVELKYDFLPGLYAVANIYGDNYDLRIDSRVAVGSQGTSSYQESIRQVREMNYEGRLHYDKTWGKYSLMSFVGMNRRNSDRYSSNGATAGGLIAPGLYSLGNSREQASIEATTTLKRVNSVFGGISLGYNELVYVDFSARNDWSSTLPVANNSYFYPSVTGSFVFSKLINSTWLDYGKLRAGISKVGNDTDPYNLRDVYTNQVFDNTSFLDDPYFMKTLAKLNAYLKPESKSTYEFGLEMQFLKNRIGVDFTYYNEKTTDLIMGVTTGAETGYTSKLMNTGEAVNKGIEVMLTFVPIRIADFEWTSRINFSKNRNKIVALYGDLQSLTIANAPFKASLIARVDEPYGQIYGSNFIYDNAGNKVVGADGLYLSSDVQNLGSILPNYNAGWRNTFNYKSLSFSALVDIQRGGKFFSVTNMFGLYSGMLEESAADGVRERGAISQGVTGTVVRNVDGSYTVTDTKENTKNVTAEEYFGQNYGGPTVQNVFDANYVKLRELTLGYSLPSDFIRRFRLSGVTISAFARNLATWGLANKHFDPEMTTMGSGNIQGFEGGSLPSSKTFGVNLKLQF